MKKLGCQDFFLDQTRAGDNLKYYILQPTTTTTYYLLVFLLLTNPKEIECQYKTSIIDKKWYKKVQTCFFILLHKVKDLPKIPYFV